MLDWNNIICDDCEFLNKIHHFPFKCTCSKMLFLRESQDVGNVCMYKRKRLMRVHTLNSYFTIKNHDLGFIDNAIKQ